MQAQERFHEYNNAMYEVAMRYVDMGWALIPISLKSKTPLIPWAEYQAYPASREVVSGWFTDGVKTESGSVQRAFAIGLVTGSVSGIVVVDCDSVEALEAAESLGITSPIASVTRRGKQFFFKHPGGKVRFGNKVGGTGIDWPNVSGLDFRGDGGYVVIPPSTMFNEDGSHKHTYEWEDEELIDWNEAPVWKGKPTIQAVTAENSFTFESLSLASVSITQESVEDQLIAKVALLGRKLEAGDGRNAWLTRYAGEQCRAGNVGDSLIELCRKFVNRYFGEPLPPHEFAATVQSVIKTDMRNHPMDYDSSGNRIDHSKPLVITAPETAPEGDEDEFKPLTCHDLDEMIDRIGEKDYWLEPIIEPNSITQVVGFNGSGKTFIFMNALWAAANGREFGPFECKRKPRVLYFDWELSVSITADRMKDMRDIYGNPGENFMLWSQSQMAKELNLQTADGVQRFLGWLEKNKPDVVVMDTVRSAFRGMDETSVEQWGRFNALAKHVRDKGIAFVFMHHRTKPGMNGMGRESGSTAQLTDVDSQIFITNVMMDKEAAHLKGGLWNGNTTIYDLNGHKWTAHDYLAKRAGTTFRLKYVAELSYGKLRQPSELHTNHFIALAECIATGKRKIVSTSSLKQKARMLDQGGTPKMQICDRLDVPMTLVDRWLS